MTTIWKGEVSYTKLKTLSNHEMHEQMKRVAVFNNAIFIEDYDNITGLGWHMTERHANRLQSAIYIMYMSSMSMVVVPMAIYHSYWDKHLVRDDKSYIKLPPTSSRRMSPE